MTGTLITERNFADCLLVAFPEIKDRYQRELQDWGGEYPGNYNVVGFVFKPYLKDQLCKGEVTDFLRRFSSFLERVCASGDVEVINVVWLKLFKLLLGQPQYLELLWPLLGSATKANIRDAARRWSLTHNIPGG